MARSTKFILLVLLVLACGALLFAGFTYRKIKQRQASAARVRAELDVGYQAQVREYQRALRIGVLRSEVARYLESEKILYRQTQREIDVDLGREPGDGMVCDYWTAYASMEFTRPESQNEPSPIDILANVSLKKVGHCL
ncbi:MAG TPA: hypothetical protein VJP02_12290 [Candidatus Sulfotelmatobacter sp.]|nr:hypothetical protein [Candidatus Sulfotelmatobacter sp.]